MTAHFDSFDRRIMALLQENGALGPAELSSRINLSASQCSRRLQRLRDSGIIEKTVAVLNRSAVNLHVSALVLVRLEHQRTENERRFREHVEGLPEIVACHYVTGDLDFILHVVTRDLASYELFVREKLLGAADISSCRSNIILRTLKNTTTVSLDFI